MYFVFAISLYQRVIVKLINCRQNVFHGQAGANFLMVTSQVFRGPEPGFLGRHPLLEKCSSDIEKMYKAVCSPISRNFYYVAVFLLYI